MRIDKGSSVWARQVGVVVALTATLALAQTSMAAETMKAAVVTGGVLKIESVPVPEPAAGQVRIKVISASVNPVDWKLAGRAAPGSRSVAGRDLAGIVDAVGDASGPWKKGDAVIAVTTGAYAEYAIAPNTAVARKPAKMSFDEAAGLGVVAETAWRAVVTVGEVKRGQKVLIHGAAGGVGSSAVQIAKAKGAYVIGTASARNHAFLKSLGADETIDYSTTRFEDQVKDVDVVVNTADADTNARSVGVVKKGGILVSVVGAPNAEACAAAGIRCAISGPVNGSLLPNVVELANAGQFKVSVEQRLPLADAARAWDLNRTGHTRGKIVLEVAPEST